MTITMVPVVGKFHREDAGTCYGFVSFEPVHQIIQDDGTIISDPYTFYLSDSAIPGGSVIAATDDPGTQVGSANYYKVTEYISGHERTYNLKVSRKNKVIDVSAKVTAGDLRSDVLMQDRIDSLDLVSHKGTVSGTVTHAPGRSGAIVVMTLGGNATMVFYDSPFQGDVVRSIEVVVHQDGTGGRTITWPAEVKWPDGSEPSISSDPNATTRLVFTSYGDGYWYGALIGKDYA